MALVAGLALLAATVQPAGTAAPPAAAREAPVDPERLAAARAFVESLDPETNLRRTVDSMASLTVQQMAPELERQTGRPLAAAVRARLETAMRDDLLDLYRSIWPTMLQGMAEAYARLFTVAELRRMAELMRDPVMLRMMEAAPEVMQRTFARVNLSQVPQMRRMEQAMDELHLPRGNTESTTTTTTTTTTTEGPTPAEPRQR